MCGIFASVSKTTPHNPSSELKNCLCRRGPDHSGSEERSVQLNDGGSIVLSFFSTVLALRSGHVVPQPLLDSSSGSLLCWNGEAWQLGHDVVKGNDGEVVSNQLFAASQLESQIESIAGILKTIRSIAGPFAFVYFDECHSLVYYGRDRLGRRSLLHDTEQSSGSIQFASVADSTIGIWHEVEADGIYIIDCKSSLIAKNLGADVSLMGTSSFLVYRFSWSTANCGDLRTPLGLLNISVPSQSILLEAGSKSVTELEHQLRQSLQLRLTNVPPPARDFPNEGARVAVLFSGGLDCTVLACMASDFLPPDQSIDLLNVAFENPRVVQAYKKNQRSTESNVNEAYSCYEACPDRITGRNAVSELRRVCPDRLWRFVEVNVPYSETVAHKDKVVSLIYPHNTEMDLSIAYALYFAARGSGLASCANNESISYTTTARVLLSGLGADELFGGYTRHATAFSRRGFLGLLEELDLDVNRLGKRNLGRDDRVILDWGREARFPYLDESLVKWALSCPVWEKCGFATGETTTSSDIEPGKKVLRLVAWKLGMFSVAKEKKRAIQFGARTAKMETGRTKGTTLIS